MPVRGTYEFEIQANGNLVNSPDNLERLRKLFRDGQIISENWGPGNPGDFDNGGWHCLCHLVAGSGVFKMNGRYLWAAITHAGNEDRYVATVSLRETDGTVRTIEMDSAEGRNLVGQATLIGYIEGTSKGHVSCRGARDSANIFNGWRRQDFDLPVDSFWGRLFRRDQDGGTVWEHWCTTRDLRPSNPVGTSVVKAYLLLVSTLGGQFTATIVRGRRSYNHPEQLCALIKAGFVAREDALWETAPRPIPNDAARLLQEARPNECLKAVGALQWTPGGGRSYFMFKRRIKEWSDKRSVEADLRNFR